MPHLKPCLKSGSASSSGPLAYPATNRPPISVLSNPSQQQDAHLCGPLSRSSSLIQTASALPYAQPYVHFPPSPTLTSTHVVDPPKVYDRRPIVVAENSCALPQRGCPGRTYNPSSSSHGNHVHPSAMGKHSTPESYNGHGFFLADDATALPSLIADEGSSEESDGLISPPPESSHPSGNGSKGPGPYCHKLCTPDYHYSLCRYAAFSSPSQGDEFSYPSMFLPHPPSPRTSRFSSYTSVSSSPPSISPLMSSNRKPKRTSYTPSFTSSWDNSASCLEGF